MRHIIDERQVVDMSLAYLQAQKDFALASALTDERRSDFRLNNAWDIGSLDNELDNPLLHDDERRVLEYKRGLHADVRERIIFVEKRWAEAKRGGLALIDDSLEQEYDVMMTGLGSHIAKHILLETRRKLADPWVHPLALSQIALEWGKSDDAHELMMDQSLDFADQLDIGWDEIDVRGSLFECRKHTIDELRGVVAYTRLYDEYWRQDA